MTGLCIGLDPDPNKIPSHYGSGVEALNNFIESVVSATHHVARAYKPNFAFFEQYGPEGIQLLFALRDMIPSEIPIIGDAKRGDIGNTSRAYAKSVFEKMNFNAITVSPYMGSDSVQPFLGYENTTVYVLALTSNSGSADFQRSVCGSEPLYRRVIKASMNYAVKQPGNVGFVVGATHPGELKEIRGIVPDAPLLIPGVGAQGGDAEAIIEANGNGPAFINVSRGILYSSTDNNHASETRMKAESYGKILNN